MTYYTFEWLEKSVRFSNESRLSLEDHKILLTPSSPGSGRALFALRGPSGPPYKVNERGVLDPKMLSRDWASTEMELTCKKLGTNLKN